MAEQYVRVADLPIGSQIILGKNKFSGKYQNGEENIVWTVVSKNHNTKDSGYPSNAVTLFSRDVIRYMAFDAKEATNTLEQRRNFGNSRWKTSNIRQWLNSSGFAGQWFVPQNVGISGSDNKDASPSGANLINVARNYPYDVDEGFMRFFTDAEKQALLPATIKSVVPVDSEGQNVNSPVIETTTDIFYLPSLTEVSGLNFIFSVNYPMEGARVLSNANHRNAKATALSLINGAYYSYSLTTDKDYAYRSTANNSELLKYLDDGLNGSYTKVKPADNLGIRPMTNIKGDAVVVLTETAGVYRLVDNAKPYVIVESIGTDVQGYDVNFNVYDYDDQLATVQITMNSELLKTYNLGTVKSITETYVIPYEKLVYGNNILSIRAVDTRNVETVKTLNLELKGKNEIKNGDTVATKDGLFTVIDTFINAKGDLELTLNKNLMSDNIKGKDIVERYTSKYEPYGYFNNDYQALPQYEKMVMKSIDYQKDGTAIEEWQLIGFGNTLHTKVEMSKDTSTSNSYITKISQIFTFYDE